MNNNLRYSTQTHYKSLHMNRLAANDAIAVLSMVIVSRYSSEYVDGKMES